MKRRASAPGAPALSNVAERLAQFSAKAFNGVLLYDAGFVLNATTGIAQLFQRAPVELQRCRVSELIAQESRPLLLQHLRSVARSSCFAIGVRPDGTRFPIEISIQASLTLNGRRVKVVALRDASEDEAEHHLTKRGMGRKKSAVNSFNRATRN